MSRAITLEISESAYLALIERSTVLKKQPEQIAAEVLGDSLSDPLLQLAGSLACDEPNIGDQHDEAFGAETGRR